MKVIQAPQGAAGFDCWTLRSNVGGCRDDRGRRTREWRWFSPAAVDPHEGSACARHWKGLVMDCSYKPKSPQLP